MFQSGYVLCPACGSVVADAEGQLCAIDVPAQCCGATGAARETWPGLTAVKLLEILDSQDPAQHDGHRISVLFFASALEFMIEEVLVALVRRGTPHGALIEAVLDGHQGVHARRELYKKLTGTALGGVLKEPWGVTFLQDWAALTKARNKIAHGQYYYADSNNVLLLQRLRGTFLKAFVELHNHAMKCPLDPEEGNA